MKYLITGASGRLGRELIKEFPQAYAPTKKEMNIENQLVVEEHIRKEKPDIVIHLAAAVSVDRCETEKEWAWKTTVFGTMWLVDACKKYCPDCYFVLMSTPCVFDGEDSNEKDENYIISPNNYYGFCKALQELIVARSGLKYVIIRGNFVQREKWPYKKAFVDRTSFYLYSDTLAREIRKIVETGRTGIIHIQGDKKMSMFELAKLTTEDILPYTLEEYYKENPNAVHLTKNMCIVSEKWRVLHFE